MQIATLPRVSRRSARVLSGTAFAARDGKHDGDMRVRETMIQFEETVEVESVLEGLRTGRARKERRRRQRPMREYLYLVSDHDEDDSNRFEILRGAKDLLHRQLGWQPAVHA